MNDPRHVFEAQTDTFDLIVLENSHRVPVLVDFWAEWCAPCRVLMPVLAGLAEEYAGKFLLAKVNSDEEQALASRYGVRSLPTVKLFRNGEVVDELVGALPEAHIRDFLDRHIPRASDQIRAHALEAWETGDREQALALLRTALGEDPHNYRVHHDLARLLMEDRRYEEAEKVMRALPANEQTEPESVALLNRLGFAGVARDAPSAEELRRRIEADPGDLEARHQLAAIEVLEGSYEPALEQLLEIMRRDRGYRDDAGRKGMIAVFQILGGQGPLVSRYRAQMSAALY